MRRVNALSLRLLLAGILFSLLCGAAQANNIFYVCVGNSHYRPAPSGTLCFKSVAGANTSAREVAERLAMMGGRGVLFRSEEDRFVTRADVFTALRQQIQRAKSTRNPFLVFYFVGHGIGEGIGWNHFSVPGTVSVLAENTNIEALQRTLISTGEVYDLLEASKVPFLMLLDNCYEGKEAELLDAVLSKSLQRDLTDAMKVLRFYNQFHEPNMVFFASLPGMLTKTVPDIDGGASIGPLARRLLITLSTVKKSSPLTMQMFLDQMKSATLDRQTIPAICFAELRKPDAALFTLLPARAKPPQTYIGTGQ